ncbi:geranylgeranyl reductase family [Kingella potus]|uniref:Geranylgeranyl reductase family n=1 Tax=Kingella potus TaxID=265175 RepID=A0A377R1V9_9NEIS|nr:NAD(P)/FAD-dependent oxidoreductase [Kingella potus]UOP00685.1 tryptophan 7-halogenase [Kingella potus]STR02918.1 geranylgeranyl reductase family [Kingella potus]
MSEQFDIAIIGAGPSGAVAAALLNKQGFNVCVLEKQHFPRFVIGESLLPHCMKALEEAGFADAVRAEKSFQFKNGAAFAWGSRRTAFDFTDKFSDGPGTTFQVRREIFDQILINEAAKQGVEVRFGHGVTAFDNSGGTAKLAVESDTGEAYELTARFVLDASGYGRVLPRLLDLETPSHLPPRMAHFTRITDNITADADFDRDKILITTHPRHRDIWFWTIPFGDNTCSLGVVGTPDKLAGEAETVLKKMVGDCAHFVELFARAEWENGFPYRTIQGYSANVKTLHGKHFALLGNAAEFLDPVFSSGVTIALHSAKLAADLLGKQLKGGAADWQREFAEPLMVGVNTFRTYVNGWYDLRFQNVLYAPNRAPEIGRMISSILAGYAWDTANPFVAKSEQRLNTLAELVGDLAFE